MLTDDLSGVGMFSLILLGPRGYSSDPTNTGRVLQRASALEEFLRKKLGGSFPHDKKETWPGFQLYSGSGAILNDIANESLDSIVATQ